MSQSLMRLDSRVVGALPVVNYFLQAMGLEAAMDEHIPADGRSKLTPSAGLGVLVRNLLLSPEPLYAVWEWCQRCDPGMLQLPVDTAASTLNDDRFGRCLDKLYEADRAALMTQVVTNTVRRFNVSLDELHNDSTTVTFEGAYADALGQAKKGKPSLRIARGHNKDHRPDLKQLVYILTTAADGAMPVWSSVTHGNATDDTTHIGTWEALRRLLGKSDFLYVADSKLCTRDNMGHIAQGHGRFLTVLPQTRGETDWFREWMRDHVPQWVELQRRPNSRSKDGPEEVYWGFESPIGTGEGYRILWIRSSQKQARDILSREHRIERATQDLSRLAARLDSPRARHREVEAVEAAAGAILDATHTAGLIHVIVDTQEEENFKKVGPGRPTEDSQYVRQVKKKLKLRWTQNLEAQKAEAVMDGIFPLVTSDSKLGLAEVLAAYKHQPSLERRHEQLKTLLEVMPVNLKSATRIEAILLLYFLAQLVVALIERQLRMAMKAEGIEQLPVYPEERGSPRPTAQQVFRVLDGLRCHRLTSPSGTVHQTYTDDLTPRQATLARLLSISPKTYFDARSATR